jgi:caffeoyl-CoA O-methyltransferase
MILRPDLVDYATEHTTPPREELAALREATRAVPGAQMGTGPVVGRLLELLVWGLRPRLVVEVGTFTGIGTLFMAGALPESGRLVTCEIDPERAAFARERFAASPFGERIELVEGPALATVDGLEDPVDFAWVDGDKRENVALYDALIERLSPHGLLACDNTLRRGDVLDPADETAAAVAAFNDHVAADPRSAQVLLPLSDGVTLVRRA